MAVDPKTLRRYRANPVAFVEECLIDPQTNKPFGLLPAEHMFLKHALKIGRDGRLLYSELIYSCPKKGGKTTFAGILAVTVIVLFGERYAEGYCAANDLEQAQSRVFEVCRRLVEVSPLLKGVAKVQSDRIVFPATGATITALASNYASAAGSHPTVAIFDELWGYTSERSRRMWDELIPIPTRKISCRLITSHAGFSGEFRAVPRKSIGAG